MIETHEPASRCCGITCHQCTICNPAKPICGCWEAQALHSKKNLVWVQASEALYFLVTFQPCSVHWRHGGQTEYVNNGRFWAGREPIAVETADTIFALVGTVRKT